MSKQGDRHTQERFDWLDRIARDRSLTHFAVRVGVTLMGYVNRITGEAWPSQETLANDLGASFEGVRLALKKLEDTGYLVVDRGIGRRIVNRYMLTMPAENGADDAPFIPTAVGEKTPAEPPTHVGINGLDNPNGHLDKPGQDAPFIPTAVGGFTQPPLGQNPLKEPTEGEGDKPLLFADDDLKPAKSPVSKAPKKPKAKAKSKPKGVPPEVLAAFEAWWVTYPRKVGKPVALKAFVAALKRDAGLDAMMTGTAAFAASRAGKDPSFTAHPSTYLNRDGWNDEIAADFQEPPKPAYRGGRQAWSALDQAAAMAFTDEDIDR